jgi:hypothetical protein
MKSKLTFKMMTGTHITTVFNRALFYKHSIWWNHLISCKDIKSAHHPKFISPSYRQREYDSDHSPPSHAKVWERYKLCITYNSASNGVQGQTINRVKFFFFSSFILCHQCLNYIALYVKITTWNWSGSGHGIIEVLPWHLPGGTKG